MGDEKHRIVFVDDDEDLLKVLVNCFEAKGFEIKALSTGKAACDFLMDEANMANVDLIVLDRMLPDMDGVEIMQKLKEKYHARFPVLFLSSLSAEKDILQGLRMGAIDYVGKPFNINVLQEKAFGLISRKKNV